MRADGVPYLGNRPVWQGIVDKQQSVAGTGWRVFWMKQQRGVTRYNCADSLDRTNVGSFFGAIQVGGLAGWVPGALPSGYGGGGGVCVCGCESSLCGRPAACKSGPLHAAGRGEFGFLGGGLLLWARRAP